MNTSWRVIAILAMSLAVLVAIPNAATVALCLLILWSFRNSTAALQSLCLAVLIKFLNPDIFNLGSNFGPLFWTAIFVGVFKLLSVLRRDAVAMLWPVWLFAFVAAILSCLSSSALSISLLKLFAFVLIVTAVMSGANSLDSTRHERLQVWINSLAIVVACASALTLLNPHVAFLDPALKTGRGLRGIFNHPQTLGIFLAPFVSMWTARLIVKRNTRVLSTAIVVGIWAIMFLTQARTAAIAATLGVLTVLTVHIVRGRRDESQRGATWIVSVISIGGLSIAIAALSGSSFSQSVTSFLMKREGASDLTDAFYASRGAGMQLQWQNFLNKPVTGNGFGVYANGEFPDGVVEIAGIPISAPVEKGFVPTTLLEETGVLGFTLFALAVFILYKQTWSARDLTWVALITSALLVNIGEAVILSPSGNGLIVWLMIGMSVVASRVETDQSAGMTREPPPNEWRPANLMT